MHGGRALARGLREMGVRVIFTLNGGHVQAIYDGCLDEGVRVVDMRHEGAVAMAADAYARVTRGLGVAVVTAGPGLTNAITGIANAHANDSPLLVICGQAPTYLRGKGALQELPHVELVRTITVWANTCSQPGRVTEYLREAAREALEKRGPSLLEIPMDVLLQEHGEDGYVGGLEPATPTPPDEALQEAARLLSDAERPVVVAGAGCYWCGGEGELRELAEALQCPVYTQSLARGSLPPGHPLLYSHTRREALRHADVVLLAGTALDFRLGYGGELGPGTRVVQLDYRPGRLGLNRPEALLVPGDVRMGLARLSRSVRPRGVEARRGWLEQLRRLEEAAIEELRGQALSWGRGISALRFCLELARYVDERVLVVGDGGNVVSLAAKVIEVQGPGRFLDPGPLGCLGIGLPFALAAKLARPGLDVLVVQGDGSLGFNFMEFHSLIRHQLPVVCAVGNDGGWGQERGVQAALFGRERLVACELGQVRYDEAVKALGGHGELVERPEDILPALERARASRKPACVNVLIDPESNVGLGVPRF